MKTILSGPICHMTTILFTQAQLANQAALAVAGAACCPKRYWIT